MFQISFGGALTSLYSFTGGYDGANPQAELVQGGDGYFYGTTFGGGQDGLGTAFKISPGGALSTFSLWSLSGGNHGANPSAGLVQGSDGNFYGTASGGGRYTNGTVFQISTNGALSSLCSFNVSDGDDPQAGLVQGSDGNFYGTASGGGQKGYGTVFKIDPNGALTGLYSFTGGNDGANPAGVLVQGSDGNFYGTASGGGRYTNGTVFQISTNGALSSLYSFTGGNDGAYPKAGLVQGSDGNFYGTTSAAARTPTGPCSKSAPMGC